MEVLKNIIDGDIKNGYSPNASEKNTGHWVLGLGALGDNGLVASEIKPVEATQKIINCRLYSGDFLVSRSNTPDKVGRSVLFKGEIDNCSYPDLMMRFRVNESTVDAGFIEAKLKSYLVRGYFKRCAAGSSSTMVKINKSTVENTPLLLPPLFEQKKIARILSTWDKAIETVEKLIENSKAQKKALMQKLLTGKRRLPGFDDEWKEICLGEIVDIETGTSKIKFVTDDGENFILDMGSVSRNGKLIPSKRTNLTAGFLAKGQLVMPKDDIGGGNIIGRVGYVDQDCKYILSDHVYLLTSKDCDSLFLSFLINHDNVNRSLRRKANGTAQLGLGKKDVIKQSLFLPLIIEQQKIASVLTTADKEIKTLQQKLDCLKQEKKALMQQLLTGKRRVKADR